jgi:hypothetical protein
VKWHGRSNSLAPSAVERRSGTCDGSKGGGGREAGAQIVTYEYRWPSAFGPVRAISAARSLARPSGRAESWARTYGVPFG